MFEREGIWGLLKAANRILVNHGVNEDRLRIRRFLHPVRMGTLRRTRPLSAHWGSDRGTPVDRYYIEQFLRKNRADIHGRVLEVMDSRYTDRYGVAVENREVLDIDSDNREATIIADLAAADSIPSSQFDCFLLIQTLQYIYHAPAAIAHAYRILKPGGTLLVTVPAVSKVYGQYSDYWRFTVASCSSLLGKEFEPSRVTVQSYGNVLAAIAFLAGMATEDLSLAEMEADDSLFPVVIAARAVK